MSTPTPRPWRWLNYSDGRKMLLAKNRAVIHCPDAPMSIASEDSELIVRAVNAHDDLVAALKGLRIGNYILDSLGGVMYIGVMKNTATATPDPKRCLCGHSSEIHTDVLSEGVRSCRAIEWRDSPCTCDCFQSSAWSVAP